MTHQVNRCHCGRTMHWPGNAKPGFTWKCNRCGTVTTLVPRGSPGADTSGIVVPSKARTANAPYRPMRSPAASQPRLSHAQPRRSAPPPSLLSQLADLFGLR